MASDDILFEKRGRIGRVVLNRPKALNALTLEMAEALLGQLRAWRTDADVRAVVIRGAGDKAFCAGGDVIRLYEDGRAKGPYPNSFYRTEYRCNTSIKLYPKPYIALMDGIVMGGGVGVSIHGSHRVVSERTTFAMPETGIGLFPDVGGTYFLPRLPGKVGLYLGLTGRRLKAGDCINWGLAEAYVPHDRMDALEDALAESGDPSAIAGIALAPPEAPGKTHQAAIDRHFSCSTIEAIIASLEADGGAWAQGVLQDLRAKAPLSLKITIEQMKRGAAQSFEDAMRMEWRLASRFAADHDFYEGVRALLVDKDMAPRWQPAALADVAPEHIDRYFAPLPGDELDLSDIITERAHG